MASTKTFPRGVPADQATVTVTRTGKIWLLSMHNTENNLMDNRLSPLYIKDALLPALTDIELEFWTAYHDGDKEAALVITGERVKHKFFSNGLDLVLAAGVPHFFRDLYYKLLTQLLTFPMHTVAAINGHCFAGGLSLAVACDWRVVRAERAWCCMNELDFGAVLPGGMTGLLSTKISPPVMRKTMLQAHRFPAPEALAAGIVDEIVNGDGEAVIARAIELAQENTKHSVSGALGGMKAEIWKTGVEALKADDSFLLERRPDVVNAERFKLLQDAVAGASAKL